ncbi:MAG: Na+/H+ antiporter subunit E [Burkholderiaceae bacterium]|nr:Na+/H+ antiporter subunit E [Burkholderiaceae bacterium]
MKSLLPAPWLSFGIFCGWLLLNRSLGPGHLLLAALLAVVAPLLTAPLRPRAGPLRRLGVLARLILRVGREVVRSAIGVAGAVLRPQPPRDAFVVVPLELHDAHALAALAMITTVIPGTVWSELAPDRSALLLHVFDLDDEARFLEHFIRDYVQPLKEIYQ